MTILNDDRRSGCGLRVILAVVMVLMAFGGYYCSTQKNPITGEKQHIRLTPEQEVRLGLQSAPHMIEQMHGEVPPGGPAAQMVQAMGQKLAGLLPQNPYEFQFHLLADDQTINAFALPGGQVFITQALLERLHTEAQLAGVLGHEIGHVVHRHSAEQMAKSEFYQGLVNAAAVGTGSYSSAQLAQYVAQLRMLSYSRQDELEADQWGLVLMTKAGYTPVAQAEVMQILKEATGSSERAPNFTSTHPDPEARIVRIKEWIAEKYPQGVPSDLTEGRPLHAGLGR